jgi:hypothetical protein
VRRGGGGGGGGHRGGGRRGRGVRRRRGFLGSAGWGGMGKGDGEIYRRGEWRRVGVRIGGLVAFFGAGGGGGEAKPSDWGLVGCWCAAPLRLRSENVKYTAGPDLL